MKSTIPAIYVIHASEVDTHQERINDILQKLKGENRISTFININIKESFSHLDKVRDNDGILLLLTKNMEPQVHELRDRLKVINGKLTNIKIIEILIENIPYDNEFLTFPIDYQPLQNRQDKSLVWKDMEQSLKTMFPAITPWSKYLVFVIPVVILLSLLFWWLFQNGSKNDIVASFNANPAECEAPCEVTFENKSENAASFNWDFGDGTTSSIANPTHLYDSAGNYTVTLIASIDGQSQEKSQVVQIKSPVSNPVADFSSNKTECEVPCTVVFNNESKNADKYNWDFGNGDSSEEVNPTYTFNTSGRFTIKLTAFLKGQQQIATQEIVVGNSPEPAPVARFIPSIDECIIPCKINFRNESQNATAFRWDFGDGTTSMETNPSHEYTASQEYNVKLIALNKDQKSEATKTISIRATVDIEPFHLTTTGANAIIDDGDDEIDSDDWTSVKLSYNIEKVNANREIRLTLVWYAQERNSDKSPGDTRFKSSKTFTLFKVEWCCPGTVISDIQGIRLSATSEEYYRGEVHGFKPFPNTGSLQGIKVQFDGSGRHDEQRQALEATLPAFSVRLSAGN